MRIAMISTPFVAVPPKDYGGTELVVSQLTESLVARGHDVTLFATGDSETSAELRWLYPRAQWPPNRLPELFCGMTRAGGTHPVLYPVSCSPQAWASGALCMLIQSAIGIFPDASKQMLHIRQPWLPPFLNELVVRGLKVGNSRVSLQFVRRGPRTLANLLAVEGTPLQVRIDLT